MRRGSTLATLAGVALVFAIAASGAAGPALSAPATRVVFVAPVDRHGRELPGDVVTRTSKGSCEPGSDVLSGSVYRCFFGNFVVDPCWAVRAGATPTKAVLCMEFPWSRQVIRLDTHGLAPSTSPQTASLAGPWGVQLANGDRCLAAQGAHGIFKGRVVDYQCTKRLALLRGVRRAQAVWTYDSVVTGASGISRPGPTESVRTAWFGGWRGG